MTAKAAPDPATLTVALHTGPCRRLRSEIVTVDRRQRKRGPGGQFQPKSDSKK